MFSGGKSESVELTSSLIQHQRPSVSSASPDVPSSNFLMERLRSWSREKDRKIYLLIFGAIVAMFIWVALLSLQISSVRRANLHSDEIESLKAQMLSLKGELENAQQIIMNLQTGQAEYSKSLQMLEDDDANVKISTDSLNQTTIQLKQELTNGSQKLALKIEAIATQINGFNLSSSSFEASKRLDQLEKKLETLPVPKVGDIKYSTLKDDHAGWLMCDGRNLSITMYSELHKVLESRNKTTEDTNGTFRLLDARGRSPLGAGKSGELSDRLIGQYGGEETANLREENIPSHFHKIFTESRQVATSSSFGSKIFITTVTKDRTGEDTASNFDGISSRPHNNMHPFVVLNTFIYSGVSIASSSSSHNSMEIV